MSTQNSGNHSLDPLCVGSDGIELVGGLTRPSAPSELLDNTGWARYKDLDPIFEAALWEDFGKDQVEILGNELFGGSSATQCDFRRYFDYYREEIQQAFRPTSHACQVSVATHQELFDVIKNLYNNRHKPLREIRSEIGEYLKECSDEEYSEEEKNSTIVFCLRIWLMFNVRHKSDDSFYSGTTMVHWEDDSVSLDEFLASKLYPKIKTSGTAQDIDRSFSASSLRNRNGPQISIVYTENLADHLKYNRKAKQLDVFHHTEFLHANSWEDGKFPLNTEFFKETLDTLRLLFHPKEDTHYSSIPTHIDLNRDILRENPTLIRDIQHYKYYGPRLEILNEELKNNTQRTLKSGPWRVRKVTEVKNCVAPDKDKILPDQPFEISLPPRQNVLARAQGSWIPPFTWSYFSTLSRRNKRCPRLQPLLESRFRDFGYLMVAIFEQHQFVQEYRIDFRRNDLSEKELFEEIRRSYKYLYGWRRFVSLKSLSGFGLYYCDGPDFESHSRPDSLSTESETALARFYKIYCRPGTWLENSNGIRTAWATWIDINFNKGSGNPQISNGVGLELIIGWSGIRIVAMTVFLVLTSFFIGIVYGQVTNDPQTAWSIASYFITATGVLAAVLAVLWQHENNKSQKELNTMMRSLQSIERAQRPLLGVDPPCTCRAGPSSEADVFSQPPTAGNV